MALPALIARKEESTVLDDPAAHAVAVNIPVEGNYRTRRIEIVLRVEPLVAQEFVTCPVQAVGAALGNRVDHDSCVAPIFGVERVTLHLEFPDHVNVRLKGNLDRQSYAVPK